MKRVQPFRCSDQEWEPFRYSPQEWAKVETCLAKLPAKLPDAAAGARSEVERIVGEYLIMAAGTNPRSPDVIATNARWAKVAKHALALNAAIEELKTLDGLGLLLLQTAVSGNRKKQPVDYLIWESQCAKVASLAARQAQASQTLFRKLKRGNRSRGYWVYLLFAQLLEFWSGRGGRVGKGAKSPSTLFVEAAASRALAETAVKLLPRAIVDFASKKVNRELPPVSALSYPKAIVQLERPKETF